MTRGVSTVLDVSLCVLLVGAAVLTLTTATSPAPDPSLGRAEETASTLGTATATVEYPAGERTHTSRGTLAGLLADAAVANASHGDREEYRDAVGAAVEPAVGGRDWRGQVVSTWRPYRGADAGGRARVGADPPPDADVHAATLSVPSGLPPAREHARVAAQRDGYRGVAAAVARATVGGLFPPEETGRSLSGPGRSLAMARYRALGDRYGVPVERALERGGPRRANERLRATMTDRIAVDMRSAFDSPAAAADAVRVGTVRITVRGWAA